MFYLGGGRLRASSFDQVSDLNPAMGIEYSSQPFLLLIIFPWYTGGGKNTSNLGKYADGVNRIDIRDDVRVCLFVFEEERA